MSAPGEFHVPVLLQQVVELLKVKPGGLYIDGTLGLGGHTEAILKAGGSVLGMDADPHVVGLAEERLRPYAGAYKVANRNYKDLAGVAREYGFFPADGVLFDLGFSSWHVERAGRGFSFDAEEPLDMRFDPRQTLSAATIVNTYSVEEIARLLKEYGEEQRAWRIAQHIVARRPVTTARELAQVVEQAVGSGGRIHPATRTFQALRIAVNDELRNLERALPQAVSVLASGGRLVVISYHSLEDRIVKAFLMRESRDCLCPPGMPVCQCGHKATTRVLTKKVVRPDEAEVRANPRSRSARLRAAERL